MGHYYIHENMLVTTQPSIVRDESGKIRYVIVGKWGTKGDVLSLFSVHNEKIAYVRQELSKHKRHNLFTLYLHDKKMGRLQPLVSIKKDFYLVTQLNWLVIGDIANHHYAIYQINQPVMRMRKTYLAKGDFYELDIIREDMAPLCICLAILLDYWQLNRHKETSSLLSESKLGWAYKFKPFKD